MGPAAIIAVMLNIPECDYRKIEIAYDMFLVGVIQYIFKQPFSGGFVL
jgi:hypothetical protein